MVRHGSELPHSTGKRLIQQGRQTLGLFRTYFSIQYRFSTPGLLFSIAMYIGYSLAYQGFHSLQICVSKCLLKSFPHDSFHLNIVCLGLLEFRKPDDAYSAKDFLLGIDDFQTFYVITIFYSFKWNFSRMILSTTNLSDKGDTSALWFVIRIWMWLTSLSSMYPRFFAVDLIDLLSSSGANP